MPVPIIWGLVAGGVGLAGGGALGFATGRTAHTFAVGAAGGLAAWWIVNKVEL